MSNNTRATIDVDKMFIKLNMPVRLIYGTKSAWGWKPYELQPRLEWLNEQIAKL
jgi:pimeloyl-ACP methyl ester carboxylesterase